MNSGEESLSRLCLPKEFEEFHDNIKLDDENQILRDKRDILLAKLKNNISNDAASYSHFNQGSYAMGTGIKPENEDYDIDVGINFDIDKDDYLVWYNKTRIKVSLGNKSPVEYRQSLGIRA